MIINHEAPIIMEIKCPLFSIDQSDSRKKELQNYEIKSCNSSHHGALMQSMPINLPNGYQKHINRWSIQRERARKHHPKWSEKIIQSGSKKLSEVV